MSSAYMSGWGLAFGVSVAAAIVLTYWAQRTGGSLGQHAPDKEFRAFQTTYLIVYYLAMLADWLQGPYVYALYESYGFSSHDIAVLFVGGFGSSMLFGTFAGAAADRIGRKACALLYCVLYIMSCMTKHVKDYSWLMLGRVLGGVATSLLFSTFESWLVCEHNARGYDPSWISKTFSLAYLGNSVAAILAGIFAEAAAELKPLHSMSEGSMLHMGGFTAPFDVSSSVLLVLFVAILHLWNENYGAMSSSTSSASDELWKALRALSRDRAIILLGLAISFFEGSMYVFVFKWTPTLTGTGDKPPYGLIFSTFMVCSMCGSSLFGIVSATHRPHSILLSTFTVAAVALAMPAVSTSVSTNFLCFLAFEMCVGVYFPAMGMLKSQLVPEEVRATVYNIFRIPLNLIVLGVLLNSLTQFVAFAVCAAMLALAAVSIHGLSNMHLHGYTMRSAPASASAAVPDRLMEVEDDNERAPAAHANTA